MSDSNPFKVEAEAKRYQDYRPRYHHLPFTVVRYFLDKDFDTALDVACGTGQSTHALSQISKKTIGCDLSESMLSEARRTFDIEFVQTPAENLPFEDNTFDLVNISMGFHWVDQAKFLKEAKRVLRPDGYLTIDNYGYLGKISDDPMKQEAQRELFKNHLPVASLGPVYPTEETIQEAGLSLVKEIPFNHRLTFSAHEFTNLIMTWSHFQALDEAQKPLTAQKIKDVFDMIFDDQTLDIDFGGKMFLYQFAK